MKSIRTTAAAAVMALTSAGVLSATGALAQTKPAEVISTYADIALAGYEDSLATAKVLDTAIDKLIAAPSQETLEAARQAWFAARVPYQQTEVYRFGNAIVDDWEGRVNAWPLDEGLIDYVDASSYGTQSDENELYTANIIANTSLTINGETVDVTEITPDLLQNTLQEAGDVEANVATGYHAIEFLLWGQDLNGTDAGAGARPATDFDPANCTGGHCDRRVQFLSSASKLLVADLEEMVGNWTEGGAAREALVANGEAGALRTILTGMGSLSYGELAGERMKLGLLLHDPEEEHDCFSDNTHNSHYYDALGISNIYHARYTRVDGSVVEGPSIAALVREADASVAEELSGKLEATHAAFTELKTRGDESEAYDQMIGEGNEEGNAVVQAAIDALVDQTRSIERAVAALNLEALEVEGSDSLDNPGAVFE